MKTNQDYIDFEAQTCAQNYLPLPIVLEKGEGVYVWDVEGNRYLDMMSAYSAVSHGHCHPRLVRVLQEQSKRLNVCSRAYYSDKLGAFLGRACELTGQERALPMNTGAEAVETALKAARKWGYVLKGIPNDQAEIIACEQNFHGRTITITAMSTETQYRNGFGPFTPGFKLIPFGDHKALADQITDNTVAFLVEPIQGEAGIIMPPPGYLKACDEICKRHNVLLICDEVQTGLGRTGAMLACQHEDVKPDALILGKALGGGIYPVSLFLSRAEVMDVFTPGDHGSTFGGNPLASALGLESLNILVEERLAENSSELGHYFLKSLQSLNSSVIQTIRGKGLFVGLQIHPEVATAREVVLRLMKQGILSKETHKTVVRLAPPLVINQAQIDQALEAIQAVVSDLS